MLVGSLEAGLLFRCSAVLRGLGLELPRFREVARFLPQAGLPLEPLALAAKPALLHGVPFRPLKTVVPADPHSPESQEQGDQRDGDHGSPDSEPHAGPSHGSLLPRLVADRPFHVPASSRARLSGSTIVESLRRRDCSGIMCKW